MQKSNACYVVVGNENFRVDVQCPLCGMINVAPFDVVKRELPPKINCKLCGYPMELELK